MPWHRGLTGASPCRPAAPPTRTLTSAVHMRIEMLPSPIRGLPQMDLDLRGQAVLITGGSQGIGLATARAFAAEGCHLHLAARTESRLREAQREITEKFGGRVEIHPIDVAVGENARRGQKRGRVNVREDFPGQVWIFGARN